MSMILSVLHEQNGGWHTFTSEQLPGLFVTGTETDLPSLLQAIPSTINALIVAGGGTDYSAENTCLRSPWQIYGQC